ncbi:MAG: YggT family protein [Halanaerobiales bacterium]|nr:YggT family protein [Halanaerobiales bacterium]
MYMLIFLVRTLFTLLNWLIIIRVIISWVRPNVYDPNLRKILRFIYNVTEPILGPIRRLLPQGNLGIDFSPLVALIILSILRSFILNLLYSLTFGFRGF